MTKFFEKFRAVDLTHTLDESVPTWSGGCGYRLEVKLDYPVKVQSVKSHAGVGTHIDAPTHFVEGSWNIADIPLEHLIVPVFVLDIRGKCSPDLFIEAEDILDFESAHGKIEEGSLFFGFTGWSQFWKDPKRYRNPDASGVMHFPGFSFKAAELLLKRGVVGLGIDTLSPDGSNNGDGARYPVHECILHAKKYIIENLTNLETMPATGALAIALPPKSRHATEMTARVVGIIPQD